MTIIGKTIKIGTKQNLYFGYNEDAYIDGEGLITVPSLSACSMNLNTNGKVAGNVYGIYDNINLADGHTKRLKPYNPQQPNNPLNITNDKRIIWEKCGKNITELKECDCHKEKHGIIKIILDFFN